MERLRLVTQWLQAHVPASHALCWVRDPDVGLIADHLLAVLKVRGAVASLVREGVLRLTHLLNDSLLSCLLGVIVHHRLSIRTVCVLFTWRHEAIWWYSSLPTASHEDFIGHTRVNLAGVLLDLLSAGDSLFDDLPHVLCGYVLLSRVHILDGALIVSLGLHGHVGVEGAASA